MATQSTPRTVTKSQLERSLKSQLGTELILEGYECKANTKPGENYGSVMLALDVTLRRTKDSPVETLQVVAKLAPPTDFLLDVFDFKNTFCKEMNVYKLVGPELERLQIECGIPDEDRLNILAKFYGAQTSSRGDNDPVADVNAILLLENLKVCGYKMGDRLAGLDLKHCELVLSKLAQFHALPVALRKMRPNVFDRTVLKATTNITMGGTTPTEDLEKMLKAIKQEIPEANSYIKRIRNHSLENLKYGNKSFNKKPFATIVHNDFWTNNMMFLYNNPHDNSCPTSIKFVDFQITLLCSPVRDLIFFLLTSASDEVLRDSFDHLLNLYHTNFINTLKRVGCDTSAFSFERFLAEVNEFAPMEFHHILYMLNVIYIDKSEVKELSELDGSSDLKFASGSICKRKILTLIHEFDKRGWLMKTQ
ncbi:uncharacterized protein [Anabrus simplex]|uniref:uncharacterized protein isoform X2 n=1 Tax=Anabrus simplex TaxID=316456 RepID=UPI0035A29E55